MTTDLPEDPGEAVKTAVASLKSIRADERALVSAMQLYFKTRSGHADYFEWPDREVVELEIARMALASAGISTDPAAVSHRGVNNDPPDCEATVQGLRYGIEVTELVDGHIRARARHRRKTNQPAPDPEAWAEDKFRQKVQARLSEKGTAAINDGPYDRYLLVIFTDEDALRHETVKYWTSGFRAPALIHRAFLLMAYDVTHQPYPLVEFELFR